MKPWFAAATILGFSFFSPILSSNELPPLLETIPSKKFETLSPVGAGKKTIEESRKQLQLEAAKVDAHAVIEVRCEKAGIRRNGLTWEKHTAYCEGKAIRFIQATPSKPRRQR